MRAEILKIGGVESAQKKRAKVHKAEEQTA
jgi:hypothetical protein